MVSSYHRFSSWLNDEYATSNIQQCWSTCSMHLCYDIGHWERANRKWINKVSIQTLTCRVYAHNWRWPIDTWAWRLQLKNLCFNSTISLHSYLNICILLGVKVAILVKIDANWWPLTYVKEVSIWPYGVIGLQWVNAITSELINYHTTDFNWFET